jgi:hypothetical protein
MPKYSAVRTNGTSKPTGKVSSVPETISQIFLPAIRRPMLCRFGQSSQCREIAAQAAIKERQYNKSSAPASLGGALAWESPASGLSPGAGFSCLRQLLLCVATSYSRCQRIDQFGWRTRAESNDTSSWRTSQSIACAIGSLAQTPLGYPNTSFRHNGLA